jgi:dipeptidyl-peptidase-4
MDRFSGHWWSPDSRFIAYEESDHEGVEVWHVADAARPDVSPFASYYPRPGKDNVKVRLGVASVAGGDTVWINWDHERYPYLTSVRWDKHGPLTLAVQTRDQHELVLLEADTASGRTTTLLTERDTAWVSVRQDVPRWLNDGRGFVWASETDAGWRLEWRNRAGELQRVLVSPVRIPVSGESQRGVWRNLFTARAIRRRRNCFVSRSTAACRWH